MENVSHHFLRRECKDPEVTVVNYLNLLINAYRQHLGEIRLKL